LKATIFAAMRQNIDALGMAMACRDMDLIRDLKDGICCPNGYWRRLGSGRLP
jgi:hypothetical protein